MSETNEPRLEEDHRYTHQWLDEHFGDKHDNWPPLVERLKEAAAEITRLKAELAEARRVGEEANEQLVGTRASHARICRGIKKILGLKNWPDFGNSAPGTPVMFVDGMLGLVQATITELRRRVGELERERDERCITETAFPPNTEGRDQAFSDALFRANATIAELRKIAAHVPGRIWIKAKEDAGYGTEVKAN